MKVVFVTNTFSSYGGGLCGAVSGLATAIKPSVEELSLAAYRDDRAERSADWGDLNTCEVNATRFCGVHLGSGLLDVLEAKMPDIVHSHGLWLRNSHYSSKWCLSHNRPYVVSPHGMLDVWAVQNSGWKKKLAGYWFEDSNLQNATCLHALCSSEAQSIRSYGLKKPVMVIPNGIHLPEWNEEPLEAPWGRQPRKALLFIGRIHPKKGLPLLLSAWAELKRTHPRFADEWFLAIAGWSEVGHQDELQRQARELNIESDIEFLGSLYRDDKAAALSQASAFILPSYSEGLPMSVLEAWSYHLPSLVTPECNLPEAFQHEAAVRIDTTVDSVVHGLRSVFSMSEQQREQLGHRAYEMVETQFTWPIIAEKMEEVYQWMLGGGDAPEAVQFV